MRKILPLVISVIIVGAGCGSARQTSIVISTSTGGNASTTSITSTTRPDIKKAVLNQENFEVFSDKYQTAVAISEGIDRKFEEINDMMNSQNYIDVVIFLDATQKPPEAAAIFRGIDATVALALPATTQVVTAMDKNLSKKAEAMSLYKKAANDFDAGRTASGRLLFAQGRTALAESKKFAEEAEGLMKKIEEEVSKNNLKI